MLASRLKVAVLAFAMGCTGLIEEDVPEGITPEQEAARKAWVSGAHPTLNDNCASCHGGSMAAVAWLEGAPDLYAQKEDLLAYPKMPPIVNLANPMSSEIIKKGAHDGPALTAAQVSLVLEWMQKERDASPMMNAFPVQTVPQAAMLCTGGAPGAPTCPFNDITLDAAGATGAKVQFTVTDVSGSLYLANLKVIPGPMGVYAEHPVFVSVPAGMDPKLDPIDRFSGVTKNLAAAAPVAMQMLGTGTATFSGFAPADPIAVYFKAVGPMKP